MLVSLISYDFQFPQLQNKGLTLIVTIFRILTAIFQECREPALFTLLLTEHNLGWGQQGIGLGYILCNRA